MRGNCDCRTEFGSLDVAGTSPCVEHCCRRQPWGLEDTFPNRGDHLEVAGLNRNCCVEGRRRSLSRCCNLCSACACRSRTAHPLKTGSHRHCPRQQRDLVAFFQSRRLYLQRRWKGKTSLVAMTVQLMILRTSMTRRDHCVWSKRKRHRGTRPWKWN